MQTSLFRCENDAAADLAADLAIKRANESYTQPRSCFDDTRTKAREDV